MGRDEREAEGMAFRPDRRRLLVLAPMTFLAGYGALTLVHALIQDGWAGVAGTPLALAAGLAVLVVGNAWLFRYRHRWLVRTSADGLDVRLRTGEQIRIPWSAIDTVRVAGRWGDGRLEITLTRQALLPHMDDPWDWMRLAGPGGLVVPLAPLVPGVIQLGTELDRWMRA